MTTPKLIVYEKGTDKKIDKMIQKQFDAKVGFLSEVTKLKTKYEAALEAVKAKADKAKAEFWDEFKTYSLRTGITQFEQWQNTIFSIEDDTRNITMEEIETTLPKSLQDLLAKIKIDLGAGGDAEVRVVQGTADEMTEFMARLAGKPAKPKNEA